MEGMFTDSNLKIRSNKTHACIYIKFITTTRLLNLLSNFVLHSKSFYGCSTFGFRNIRKVICGDLSQTLKTPCENTPNARSQLKKKPQPISTFPQRLRNFRSLVFTTFSRRFKYQRVISYSCGPLLFIFQPPVQPRAWSTGQLPRRRLRGRHRDGRGEQSPPEIFMLL